MFYYHRQASHDGSEKSFIRALRRSGGMGGGHAIKLKAKQKGGVCVWMLLLYQK